MSGILAHKHMHKHPVYASDFKILSASGTVCQLRLAASYPGANKVLTIATLQCFIYISVANMSERAVVLGEDTGNEAAEPCRVLPKHPRALAHLSH